MKERDLQKVLDHPTYHALISRRNTFSVILSLIVLTVFYSFVFVASTNPTLFSTPVGSETSWCFGILFGWGVQFFAFLMTGVYVTRANGEFDEMNRKILEETAR